MASSSKRPGVVVERYAPAVDLVFRTGVAGFVCPAVAPTGTQAAGLPGLPLALAFTSWVDFADAFRTGAAWRGDTWLPDALLWAGVQGFFLNGGARCWIALYDAASADRRAGLDAGVGVLAEIDDVDLVCAPSLMGQVGARGLIQQLIWSCEQRRGDWFLILDAPEVPAPDLDSWLAALRDDPGAIMPDGSRFHMARPQDAAVYYPWLVPSGDVEPAPGSAATAGTALPPVPASAHVAGMFARTDQRTGVHKAPANEPIEGIVDVVEDVDDVDGANPVRVFPGRGIRVSGARTLAIPTSSLDTDAFIGARRLILTLDRWLVRALDWTVFEINDFRTWVRIRRELNARLTRLFEQGAFQGSSPAEAFYVKCDNENNPADVRAAGELHVDIGVAPAVPNEFIKIRLVRSAEGITVA